METFIAFFDILGFKNIVENNELSDLKRHFDNFMIGSQYSISEGNVIGKMTSRPTFDLSNININCLHVSDSIIFWTNGSTDDDFNTILNTCLKFYKWNLYGFFAIRGCLTVGEFSFSPYSDGNEENRFYNYSFIGKALVNAYRTGESLEFVGCVVDDQVIQKVGESSLNSMIENNNLMYYKAPFKSGEKYSLVLRPFKEKITELTFKNYIENVNRMFTKLPNIDLECLPPSVEKKKTNTIDFLRIFVDPDKILIPKAIGEE